MEDSLVIRQTPDEHTRLVGGTEGDDDFGVARVRLGRGTRAIEVGVAVHLAPIGSEAARWIGRGAGEVKGVKRMGRTDEQEDVENTWNGNQLTNQAEIDSPGIFSLTHPDSTMSQRATCNTQYRRARLISYMIQTSLTYNNGR